MEEREYFKNDLTTTSTDCRALLYYLMHKKECSLKAYIGYNLINDKSSELKRGLKKNIDYIETDNIKHETNVFRSSFKMPEDIDTLLINQFILVFKSNSFVTDKIIFIKDFSDYTFSNEKGLEIKYNIFTEEDIFYMKHPELH